MKNNFWNKLKNIITKSDIYEKIYITTNEGKYIASTSDKKEIELNIDKIYYNQVEDNLSTDYNKKYMSYPKLIEIMANNIFKVLCDASNKYNSKNGEVNIICGGDNTLNSVLKNIYEHIVMHYFILRYLEKAGNCNHRVDEMYKKLLSWLDRHYDYYTETLSKYENSNEDVKLEYIYDFFDLCKYIYEYKFYIQGDELYTQGNYINEQYCANKKGPIETALYKYCTIYNNIKNIKISHIYKDINELLDSMLQNNVISELLKSNIEFKLAFGIILSLINGNLHTRNKLLGIQKNYKENEGSYPKKIIEETVGELKVNHDLSMPTFFANKDMNVIVEKKKCKLKLKKIENQFN